YSKAGSVLLDKMPNRASAAQLKGILDPQKGSGVKPEELKWSGINQFIDAKQAEKGYVTKDDIRKWLKEDYAAQFETKVLRSGRPVSEEFEFYSDNDEWGSVSAKFKTIEEAVNAAQGMFGMDREEAEVFVWDTNQADSVLTPNETEHDDPNYQLPGGKNYKEIVLRMPLKTKIDPIASFKKLNDGSFDVTFVDGEEGNYRTLEQARIDGRGESDIAGVEEFRSTHFPDVPNYVAHLRTAEHGNGLLIDELQSDLHQLGREKGYKEPVPLEETLRALDESLAAAKEERSQIFNDRKAATKTLRGLTKTAQELNWIEQASVNWANEKIANYPKEIDRINTGIETTEKEIEDYKSGKKVKTRGEAPDAPFRKDWPLQLFKYALKDAVATGKEWVGWTGGEKQAERYDLSQHVDSVNYDPYNQRLIASKDGQRISDKSNVTKEELADYIGKDLASKLLQPETLNGAGNHVLSGVDLKVGGEGMKGFYDVMLPKEIGKYVKQWGAAVEKSSLDTAPIWKIAITPEMRESVAGGQTRFMPSVAVVPERFTGTGEEEQRKSRYVEPPKAFKKYDISQYEPGGKFFDAETGEDLTNKTYENASIGVASGKPTLVANNESETAGTGPLFRANLFKQKAGWKWVSEGAPDTSTIVSVEGQGKHLYALQADFQNGVKMARYKDKASEPRLRPTGRGELTMGEQIGTIDIRGREHPVYDRVTIGAAPESATRYSPAKLESEYKTAFEAKDEERARGLVDEAAKRAGYSTEKFYHGTPTGGFNEFACFIFILGFDTAIGDFMDKFFFCRGRFFAVFAIFGLLFHHLYIKMFFGAFYIDDFTCIQHIIGEKTDV
ncbi:MAG: hypothetical protein EB015_15680, partial [Methylocystaceae bacterium]|nr:hypothetical protein [Methylocystaceae bacterium]